ncbi:MAG: ABC transporter substrate-binding protein [Candidatus Binatia bacterium]
MPKLGVALFAFAFLVLGSSPALPQLKKIRFSTTSIAITELQFRIANLKGFYREEGLELETLLIRGSVGMQALIGGSVDYASAAGSIIAAGVRGLPVRLVLIVNSKPQFDLVGQPEIKSVQQLKGKVIGISSRGGAVDLLTQLTLPLSERACGDFNTILKIAPSPSTTSGSISVSKIRRWPRKFMTCTLAAWAG